jgi:protein-disulfide isomerase
MKTVSLALVLLALPGAAQAAPPWDTVPGWTDLGPPERARVEKLANEKTSYGACTGTIAACLESKSRNGWRLARLTVYLVSRGAADEDAARILDERKASYNAVAQNIELAGSPRLGDGAAPVTIVEFADFECPACAAVSPVLKQLVKESGGKARLHFLNYPLKSHVTSLPAAQAAVVANKHGQFWEMSELLFANPESHEPADLEGYATSLKIALPKFRAGMTAAETLKSVESDKAQGLKLGVRSTPSLFVNGREFRPSRDKFLLVDRVEEELDRLEGRK